jgi:hypothetical protein
MDEFDFDGFYDDEDSLDDGFDRIASDEEMLDDGFSEYEPVQGDR